MCSFEVKSTTQEENTKENSDETSKKSLEFYGQISLFEIEKSKFEMAVAVRPKHQHKHLGTDLVRVVWSLMFDKDFY